MARQKLATKSVDSDNRSVTFEFADDNLENLVATLDQFPAEIVTELALHGLSQKLGDSYAGLGSPSEANAAVKGILERLQSGDWKAQRSGGGGAPRTTQLAKAIAKIQGLTIEQVTETIAGMDEAQVKELRKVPAVKAAMAEIRAEEARAAAKAAKADAKSDDTNLGNIFASAG